jgi:hypothetical protein
MVGARPALPAWHWGVLALLILGGLVLLLLRGWAARRSYVAFTPSSDLVSPAGQALSPGDKIALRATGWFEVNGKAQHFAGLTAYWRTYANREHAVLAIQRHTRFFIGGSPEDAAGLWYIFIRPEAIEGITAGLLCDGVSTGPALRVIYPWQPPIAAGKRPRRPVSATVYLMFADGVAREQVWADLLADGSKKKA